MDDTSIKNSLSGFETVWQRVGAGTQAGNAAAASESAAAGEEERLRAFMLSAAGASTLYSSLARRFRGAAPVLERLAAEERAQLRALTLEYYLLTGDSFTPRVQPVGTDGLLSTLRAAWLAEGRSEQSYLGAAAVSMLGPLYRAHAENEHRHGETLRQLIAQVLK